LGRIEKNDAEVREHYSHERASSSGQPATSEDEDPVIHDDVA
jgi:hypothetical protein